MTDLLILGYAAAEKRRDAVKALVKAERATKVGCKVPAGLLDTALEVAKEYEKAANAWKDVAEEWKKLWAKKIRDDDPNADKVTIERKLAQFPEYVHCYANPVREAQYARGLVQKVAKMQREIVKGDGDDDSKCKRRIHLVHSSKGGCGKTFTAITYAMYLSHKYAYGDGATSGFDSSAKRVLLIDCDFRGAGVETQFLNTFAYPTWENYERDHRLYTEAYNAGNAVNQGKLVCIKKASEFFNRCMIRNETPFLNACISEMRMYRFMPHPVGKERDICEAHPEMDASKELRIGFDVMFADSSADAKRAFLANSNRLDGSIVNCSYFKRSFETMLVDLLEKRPEYTDIIIDMSPGTDEYVDCIMDVCLSGSLAKDNRVILHAVTTSDVPHMRAMEEYLANTIAQRTLRQHEYKEIRLVINEIRRYFWDDKYDRVDERGHRDHHGDRGGNKGAANAERVAEQIIKKLNARINNPHCWLEVYSQLFLEEYTFDNLNFQPTKERIMPEDYKHPLTDVYMALCPNINPDRELETQENLAEHNRRFDLPLLFWEVGDMNVLIDPNAPTRTGA